MDSTDNFGQTYINNVKTFLKEHPDEKVACIAIIFDLAHLTLKNSIAKDSKPVSTVINNEQNRILESHQVNVIHKFIQFLLIHNIQPSKKNGIQCHCYLKTRLKS